MKRHLTLTLAWVMAFVGMVWLGRARPIANAAAPPAPTSKTRAVALFSLYYGKAADRIGMYIPKVEMEGELVAGPSHFTVARDGTLWFADAVNHQLKQFDRTGRLLRQMKTRLPRMDALSVRTDGYVYVVYNGSALQFEVFDAQGQLQPQIARQLTEAVKAASPQIALIDLRTDTHDSLYGQTFLNKKQVTIRIAPSGQITILPGGAVDHLGHIWGLQRLEDRESSVKVYKADGQLLTSFNVPAFVVKRYTVYDTAGQAIRQFNLPSTGLFSIEQSLSEIIDYRVGRQEHLYMIAPSLTQQWENVVRALRVLHWYVVMEYDNQGNRIGIRAILSRPNFHGIGVENFWDIDQAGNVYYLDFKADHVDVMMAPAS